MSDGNAGLVDLYTHDLALPVSVRELIEQQAAAIQSLEAEKAALEEAASALVAKLDECDPHLANAFVFMDAHGLAYSGPQYGEALDALRAALKPPAWSSPGALVPRAGCDSRCRSTPDSRG